MDEFVIIITLFFSGLYSGAETAFVSVNRIYIEVWANQNRSGAKEALKFIRKPEDFLMTTLVGTNIMNTVGASLAAVYLSFYFDRFWIPFITSFVILVFGEVLPKAIFHDLAGSLTLRVSPFLRFSYRIFRLFFLIQIVDFFSSFLLRIFKTSQEEGKLLFSKKDMELIIGDSVKKGIIETEEHHMIKDFLKFSDRVVKQVMVPRTSIVAIEKDDPIDTVIQVFIKTGFSRLPVYEENLDQIIGFVVVYDLFNEPAHVTDILRGVTFVPSTKSTQGLLQKMKLEKHSIAVVLDEYGGTAGLVTIEDLIEEFLGEIFDEYDIHKEWVWKTENGSYILEGWSEIDKINIETDLSIERGNFTTLSGWIITKLERIPDIDEIVEIEGHKIKIIDTDGKTIKRVEFQRRL